MFAPPSPILRGTSGSPLMETTQAVSKGMDPSQETRSPDPGPQGQRPRRDLNPAAAGQSTSKSLNRSPRVTPSPAAPPALVDYSRVWVWGHKTLMPQPLPPSPPSPRVQSPLTCLPKESETPLPPALPRALVSQGPRGGGAALPEAAPSLTARPLPRAGHPHCGHLA